MNQPSDWSFTTESAAPPSRRAHRRAVPIVVAVVAVAVIVALVTWLAWPSPTPSAPSAASHDGPKPLLNHKPPTLIEDALERETLYPPGYVDYDEKKADPDRYGPYDRERHYESTSTPPGCTSDPLRDDQFDIGSSDKGPDEYDFYVSQLMYPVDDAGGRNFDGGFSFTVFPAKNVDTLNGYRDWYRKCLNANVTVTTTKNGQFIEQRTRTQDTSAVAAPSSEAIDSLALAKPNEDVCELYGLIRGLIVEVRCPPTQKAAGVYLWRTLIHRVQEI